MSSPVYVNGSLYSFVSCRPRVGNFELLITSANYTDAWERTEAMANAPGSVGRTRGTYKVDTCELEMLRKHYEEFLAELVRLAGPTGNPNEVRFDLVMSYAEDGQPITTDELVTCQVKGNGLENQQGADPSKAKVPLDCRALILNGRLPYKGFIR